MFAWENHFLQRAQNCVNTSVFARCCPKTIGNTALLPTRRKKCRKYRGPRFPRCKKNMHLRCFFLRDSNTRKHSLFDDFQPLRDGNKIAGVTTTTTATTTTTTTNNNNNNKNHHHTFSGTFSGTLLNVTCFARKSEGSGEVLGGFGAEPGQVQQGSGEGSGEGLRGFDAKPGQVQYHPLYYHFFFSPLGGFSKFFEKRYFRKNLADSG